MRFCGTAPCRSLGGLVAVIFAIFCLTPGAEAKSRITVSGLDFAKSAIVTRHYALARKVLDLLVKTQKDPIEAHFLLGKLDEIQGRFVDAVNEYRQILAAHPKLPRVRLDLALLLFKLGDDESAEYNFRLSLGEHLPGKVEENVFRMLDTIRARRRFQFDATFAIAPDTNVNNGPGQRQITIFGLPATLSDTARGQSGVGGFVSLSAQYRFPLNDDYRFRVGAAGYRAQYGNTDFDDMFVRSYAGPERLFSRGDVSFLGVFDKRWYGDVPYSERFGPRIEGEIDLSPRWRLNAGGEFLGTSYSFEKFMNGTYADVSVTPTYIVASAAYAYMIFEYAREDTAASDFSNSVYRAALGYHQEISGGFTYSIQPEFLINPFQAVYPLFGETRFDRLYRLSTSIYNRRWYIGGFCPILNYIYTRDRSNIALYSYQRSQVQLGLTKEF